MGCTFFLCKKIKNQSSFFSFSNTLISISTFISSFLITSIVLILSGFRHEINKRIKVFSGDFQFVKYNESKINISDFKKHFKNIKGINKIVPFVKRIVLIQGENFTEGGVIYGYFDGIDNLKEYLHAGHFYSAKDEIILGKILFENLRIELNDNIQVCLLDDSSFYNLKVVGVFETGIDEVDSKVGLCDIKSFNTIGDALKGEDMEVEGINIFFDGDYQELRRCAMDYEGRLYKFNDRYSYVNDWIKILTQNGYLYILIIFFAVVTNLVGIIVLQLLERNKMINVLLYLGMPQSDIENIFLLKNLRFFVFNMLVGVGCALFMGWLQYFFKMVKLSTENYYLNFVPIYFDIKILSMLLISLIACVMAVFKITFLFIRKK